MNMTINDNIMSLLNDTPSTIILALAERVKQRRLELNWTQKLLAAKAGRPIATYRRFERTGEVSLRGLVMLSAALDCKDDFDALFADKKYQSIDDVLNADTDNNRKKGTKNE